MAWRIGDLLDIYQQLDWIADAGFDGIGFHASAGSPGNWQGIDPCTVGREERAHLRMALSRFTVREVHAPFSIVIQPDDSSKQAIDALRPVLAFAGEVGADVVTVHGCPPEAACDASVWQRALETLNAAAHSYNVRVGLEMLSGFAKLAALGLPHVGITLDVGHLYLDDRKPLRPFGTLGNAVRQCGPALFHLHLHDVRSELDHLELGTGVVDFNDLLQALAAIGYCQALCLELNPDRVSPEGIRRSLDCLRRKIDGMRQ
jgi:sugar phosphate isomerase/epimerase